MEVLKRLFLQRDPLSFSLSFNHRELILGITIFKSHGIFDRLNSIVGLGNKWRHFDLILRSAWFQTRTAA